MRNRRQVTNLLPKTYDLKNSDIAEIESRKRQTVSAMCVGIKMRANKKVEKYKKLGKIYWPEHQFTNCHSRDYLRYGVKL